MTRYIERNLEVSASQADTLRSIYWRKYGATLLGLIKHHGVDPVDFLNETHDLRDFRDAVPRSAKLIQFFSKLKGKTYVFSNSPSHYLNEMLSMLGISKLVDGTFSIESTGFNPKPSPIAYLKLLAKYSLKASSCIMVEDSLDNLRTAKKLGMSTILVSDSLKTLNWVDGRVRRVC